jgi:Domain of unknown function (DUF4328)
MSASDHAGVALPLPGGFVPLRPLARWAIFALFLVALMDLVAVWSDLRELSLVNKLINGEDVPLSTIDSNDTRQSAVGWAAVIVFFVTVVVFLRWFSRGYKNLVPLGSGDLRYRPGWAIGAWFVPILALWRPKQIANDIWRASDPDDPDLLFWHEKAVPALLTVWWAAWIIIGQIGSAVLRAAFGSDTPEKIRTSDRADLALSVADIATCVLAVLVVRSITARQDARAAVLTQRDEDLRTGQDGGEAFHHHQPAS